MATLSFTCPKCQRQHDRVKTEMAGFKVRCQCGHVFRLGPKQEPTPSKTKAAPSKPVTAKPAAARPVKPSAAKKPPVDDPEIDKLLQPRDVSESDSFDDFDDSGVLDQIIAASNAPPANPTAAAEVDELIRSPRFKTSSTNKATPAGEIQPAAKSKPTKNTPQPSEETTSATASATSPAIKDYSVDDLLGGFDTPDTAAPESKLSTPTTGDDDLLEPLDDDLLEPMDDDILEPIIEEQEILEPIIPSAVPPQGVYVPTPAPLAMLSDPNAPLTDPSLPLPGHVPGAPPHLLDASNPYATPSLAGPYVPSAGKPRNRRRGARGPTVALTIPGIFLIVIGVTNLLLMAFLFFVDIAATSSDFGMQQSRFNNNPFSNNPFDQGAGRRSGYAAGRLAGASIMRVAQVGLCIATILGGIAMAKASGFRTALVGSIVALVPLCTPLDCVLVEPAVGLWALIVICVMKDQFTN